MKARLFCRTGEMAGSDHSIGREAKIGRRQGNDVVIPREVISDPHARIFWSDEDGCYFLEDSGSKNGTRLAGVAVRGRAKLNDLDVVNFAGIADFVFQIVGSESADEWPRGGAAEGEKTVMETTIPDVRRLKREGPRS